MTEIEPRLKDALAHIGDAWEPARSEQNLLGTRRRYRRSQRRRAALGAACVLAALGVLALAKAPTPTHDASARVPAPPPLAANTTQPVQFEDGSQIELLDPDSQVVVDEVTAERVSVRLLRGRVRVEVVPRKQRAFRVDCGIVSVEVLGTAFELLRQGERTHVAVLRGRVAVHAPEGTSQLGLGEAAWFPRAAPEPVHVSEPAARAPRRAATKGSAPAQPAQTAQPSWRAQVERGDYTRAYELMPATPDTLGDDVQALLLAADAARLSGHPAQAEPFLRRVMDRHANDSRAGLAAFTLAGMLLQQLDRPREAEVTYARARRLALSPTLAQDALARQVEAAQRAGDAEKMRELAREYLRRYPDGRRVQWVRDKSGL